MIRFIHAGIKSTSRINDSLSGSFDISELIVCSSLSVTFSCFNALRAYIRGIKICFNLDYSSGDTVVLCTMPSSVTGTLTNHDQTKALNASWVSVSTSFILRNSATLAEGATFLDVAN
jgi:hypothetical protein